MTLNLKMPQDTIGSIPNDGDIARGPFVAVHNGINTLGGFMRLSGDGDEVTFYSGDRAHTIDSENYVITQKNDTVTAVSAEWESMWLFRSLRVEDIEWLVPEIEQVSIQTLEQLREWAKEQLLGV